MADENQTLAATKRDAAEAAAIVDADPQRAIAAAKRSAAESADRGQAPVTEFDETSDAKPAKRRQTKR